MKYFILSALLLTSCRYVLSESKFKLTELEVEKGKRIASQLQVIQMQATPLQKEQSDLALAACKRAGLTLENCNINLDSGEITPLKKESKQEIKK